MHTDFNLTLLSYYAVPECGCLASYSLQLLKKSNLMPEILSYLQLAFGTRLKFIKNTK